jgi:hypothetical protein
VHPFATGAFKNALADHGFRRSAMRLNTKTTVYHSVMAGLRPGHPRLWFKMKKDVDARHKAGHDELGRR